MFQGVHVCIPHESKRASGAVSFSITCRISSELPNAACTGPTIGQTKSLAAELMLKRWSKWPASSLSMSIQ